MPSLVRGGHASGHRMPLSLTWQLLVGLSVDGRDVSGLFRPALSSVSVTDAAGVDADELTVILSGGPRWAPVEEPEPGVEIEVRLGIPGAALGTFTVDETEIADPPSSLTITAAGAAFMAPRSGRSPLTTAKTRSWPEGTRLADMVAKVAAEHGLQPVVGRSLQAVVLPHVDQRAESDIALLTRLVRDHDAFAKPAGPRLIVARRGEGKTESGAAMPVLRLARTDISTWSRSRSEPEGSGEVVAVWRDRGAAADVEVTVGSGEPVRRLRRVFPDAASAQAAAEAERARAVRAKQSLEFRMPGRIDVVAEALVVPAGWHPKVDGRTWAITRAVHTVDGSGWSVAVTAEPASDGAGATPSGAG